MHPTDGLRGTKSHKLLGRKIVLGITGSIAAVECFELARELIRHGADVHAVLSDSAQDIVTPWAMAFATGNEVVEVIDWRVQHVSLLGNLPGRADLLLIAPSTANTISKIACGIDDTTVTTMATTALGSGVPILIAPAMHRAMYQNPAVQKNVETLKEMGIGLIGPRIEEGKAKVANIEEIVEAVIRRLGKNDLSGRMVLVIGGSSEEPIDEMRVITNKGSGETAVEIATAAYERGANVELWMGRANIHMPSFIETKRFSTIAGVLDLADGLKGDIVIVPAALSDFAPKQAEGKLPSESKDVVLRLCALPKVLDMLRDRSRVLVGFKAESGVTEAVLLSKASKRLKEAMLDLIVANDLKDVTAGGTKAFIVGAKRKRKVAGTKAELANALVDEIVGLKG
ncbi:MAG: bifunctional phosphopantothenoylcysteine decarboxylase/phosphopantothenate--cysteine ligase CoaBC [Methanomassiliicoccales archaeon]|nr:bifunctional phosphopantothenoylcysteine decarboxylase/phosphopantothenate--cysteine ligase CoaBC [Methanomassiliicoccales archaeon]